MTRPIDIRALLKKVRRIRIQSRKTVESFMAGQFRSAFKGAGIEFREVRPYIRGDDIRAIDWKVTARTGMLHMRTYEEEREQCVIFCVDASRSLAFGSRAGDKWDTVMELCALCSFSALQSNDRVGLILFAEKVISNLPPKKGMDHGLRIMRDLVHFGPGVDQGSSSIEAGLDYLMKVRKKRAVVFLVSDFLDKGYEKGLSRVSARHDLIAVNVRDRREQELDGGGVIRLHDLETGEPALVDLSSDAVRRAFREDAAEERRALKSVMSSSKIDLLELEAGLSSIDDVRSFFKKRIARRRR